MEADTTSKHGRISKSHTSRGITCKQIVFFAAVLTASFVGVQNSNGQQNGILGIRAGANFTKISGDLNFYGDIDDLDMSLSLKFKPGFQIGLVLNFPMNNDKLMFQTGIIYAQQGAKWEDSASDTDQGVSIKYEMFVEMTLNYLQVPANFLYRHYLNSGNILLLQAGPYLGYGLGGNLKIGTTVSAMGFSESESFEETIKFGSDKEKHFLKTLDLGLGFGIGMLFNEKFQVGVGYNFGLTDIGHRVEMKNNGIALTLAYMFGSNN